MFLHIALYFLWICFWLLCIFAGAMGIVIIAGDIDPFHRALAIGVFIICMGMANILVDFCLILKDKINDRKWR